MERRPHPCRPGRGRCRCGSGQSKGFSRPEKPRQGARAPVPRAGGGLRARVPTPRARGGWGGWDGWAGPAARGSGLGAGQRGAARPGSRAAWAPSADRRRPPPPSRLGDAKWGCGPTTSLARQGRGQGAVPP